MRLCHIIESPGKCGFFFSSWQAYCALNAGERVDMELISQHIRQILERNTMGCAKIEENCFFFSSCYSSSITGVCLWDLHESRMSHELFSASWNAYCKVDLTVSMSAHVIFFFFPTCCRGTGMERCVRKGIVLKTSWVNVDKGASADCVVFNDVWAGPCRLATQCCFIENIC